MRKSKSCSMRSVTPLKHISKIVVLPPREQPTIPTKERCRQSSEKCRTPGSATKQIKFNTLKTATTLNASMMPLRLSTALSPLKHLHCSVLMGQIYSPRRTPSWRDGRNISTVSYIGPRLSTLKPWLACLK